MSPIVLMLDDGEARLLELAVDRQRLKARRDLQVRRLSRRGERETIAYLGVMDALGAKLHSARAGDSRTSPGD